MVAAVLLGCVFGRLNIQKFKQYYWKMDQGSQEIQKLLTTDLMFVNQVHWSTFAYNKLNNRLIMKEC